MKKILNGIGFILAAGVFVAGCNEPDQRVNPPVIASQPASLEPLKQYLSTITGAPVQKIAFDQKEQEFIVDGDMVFGKKEAEQQFAADQGGKTAQRRAIYLLNNEVVQDIKVYISPDVPANWRAAAKLAIPDWNSIPGTRLHVKEVTSASSANLTIVRKYQKYVENDDETHWVARQSYPTMSGNIGGSLRINAYYESNDSLPALAKRNAVVHELGHAIGLSHTDVPSKQIIDFQVCGTPALDPASVMHSIAKNWTGFTEFDRLSVQTMYPFHTYSLLPGSARDIGASLGPNKALWVIGNSPVGGGYSVHRYNYSTNTWSEAKGMGGTRIAADPDGAAWIINNLGLVYKHVGSKWVSQGALATDIAVGPNTAYIVTKKATVNGFIVAFKKGNGWQEIPGLGGVKIAVTTQGIPWLVDNAGRILRLSSSGFAFETGTAKDIAAGQNGSVYTLGTQSVYGGYAVRQFRGNCWMQVGNQGGVALSAFGDASGPVMVTNLGQIYKW